MSYHCLLSCSGTRMRAGVSHEFAGVQFRNLIQPWTYIASALCWSWQESLRLHWHKMGRMSRCACSSPWALECSRCHVTPFAYCMVNCKLAVVRRVCATARAPSTAAFQHVDDSANHAISAQVMDQLHIIIRSFSITMIRPNCSVSM